MMKQIVFFLALASSASAIELTPDNWDAETSGKSVFIKFFAPWCGHCKALAPDWEKLTHEFEGSSTQLVAEVDCTAGGEPLCNEFGIQGFPTLKYGDPSDLQDYEGGRSLEDLRAFAEENLKPMCSIKNLDLCDAAKKAEIEKLLDMSVDELKAAVEGEEKKIADADANFEAEVKKLQERYEMLLKEVDDVKAAAKEAGLGMMKSVLASKKAGDAKDEL
ncbi:hypothetical protein HJC23_009086 [Cyclotella cryptica]|uniref:Thioredoxin domain-containing protein n=1 Tax=Cyclotella cryptica TaxID=29204 RepID=A0ABD3QZC8_9STRA|eukprot:CCRYP_000697-RA/>CCRYP_000697-RA protein AED:0.04 eAED:0.04 QI:98/1/1/1/1/1/2/201/218